MKQSARSVEIVDQTGAADDTTLRYALADGTSASPQARAWSQILAQHACRVGAPREKGDVIRWLSGAHDAWQDRFQRSTKLWTQPDLPELGAAALCLIELTPTETGFRWATFLQGDVCLFQIRDGQTIRRLPMEHSQAFGRSKPCFFSEPIALNHQPMQITASGTVGDILVMASEPLARWLYAQLELGSDPWQELLTLPDDTAFAALVNRERAAGRMQDDDTALMLIRTAPVEDRSLLDAPSRGPVTPPLRPPRPPELDATESVSSFEDIFDLELLAEDISPDEATELALPDPIKIPDSFPDHPIDHADVFNEDLDDFSDEVSPPLHVSPSPVEPPDDITLDPPLDFDPEDAELDDLDIAELGIEGLDIERELSIRAGSDRTAGAAREPTEPELQLPLSAPLQPLEAPPADPVDALRSAPQFTGNRLENEDSLFGDDLELFADNESIPRPRPTLLAEDRDSIHKDGEALDRQQFRLYADPIPADVFDSVVSRPFSPSADEDIDILEALDDIPDSDDDDFDDALEMSFFSPRPTIDERQERQERPPPPPQRGRRKAKDVRFFVMLALAVLIVILLIANVVNYADRASSSPIFENLAQRMDRAELQLTSIESRFSNFTRDLTQSAAREADALSGLTDRVSALEALDEQAGDPTLPESRANPQPVAPSRSAAPARAKKKRAAVAAKKKPAVIAATSPSQIPASAPDSAWIGCPRQVCSRTGSRVTIQSVTPVWASPYSGDRVAVLGAGTYPLLAEEDVSGYLWVEVKLK